MNKNNIFTVALGFIAIFVAAFAISFVVFSNIGEGSLTSDPISTATQSTQTENASFRESQQDFLTEKTVNNRTILQEEVFYKGCRHIITENITHKYDYLGFTEDDFAKQGWQVLENSNGKIKLARIAEGFCPDDKDKFHVIAAGDMLRLYTGPLGCDNELVGEYPAKIGELPIELQIQLKQGGIEFANETEILELLDSLDEIITDIFSFSKTKSQNIF